MSTAKRQRPPSKISPVSAYPTPVRQDDALDFEAVASPALALQELLAKEKFLESGEPTSKWPGAVRLGILTLGSLVSWGLVIAGFMFFR